MNIDWVIPCRYAEVHDNLATIVGAGIDIFWLESLPAPVQVGMAVRLLATSDELGPEHDHTVRNVIKAPDGETIGDQQTIFQAGTVEEASEANVDWLNGIALVTTAAFEAAEAGTYQYELIVDDSSKAIRRRGDAGACGQPQPGANLAQRSIGQPPPIARS